MWEFNYVVCFVKGKTRLKFCLEYFTWFVCVDGLFADGEPIHHDLLKAIEVPLRDEEHITFGTGVDGFPAFVLFRGHDIKIPYKVLLPDRLYSDFSILVTIKPDNNEGIFLTFPRHTCLFQLLAAISPSCLSSCLCRWLSVCRGWPSGDSGPVWSANWSCCRARPERNLTLPFSTRRPFHVQGKNKHLLFIKPMQIHLSV